MTTKTASGHAVGANGSAAASEATRMALLRLGSARPAFGFLFASPSYSLEDCLAAARRVAEGANLAGCTTAGEITEDGLTHEGVAVMLVATESQHVASSAEGLAADPERAARDLCAGFQEGLHAARMHGMFNTTTITLVDGLAGAGERFVESIVASTNPLHQVVGGAAGDEGQFKATHVGDGERVGSDVVAALHVFSPTPWGIGIGHGLEPVTHRMRVTRARGNVVQEIEGRPAFSIYQDYAKERGVRLERDGAGEFMIANELGIIVGGKATRARAPLSAGADGSITCAAEVPQGAYVAILDGKPDAMVAAASRAAYEAVANLQGRRCAGVLLFDCICRGIILKEQFRREIDAVRAVVGDVPVAGFLTYGEIASFSGRVESWHNTTAVALAIPE